MSFSLRDSLSEQDGSEFRACSPVSEIEVGDAWNASRLAEQTRIIAHAIHVFSETGRDATGPKDRLAIKDIACTTDLRQTLSLIDYIPLVVSEYRLFCWASWEQSSRVVEQLLSHWLF